MNKFSDWDKMSLDERVRWERSHFKELFGDREWFTDHEDPEPGKLDEIRNYRIGFRDGALIYAGKPWPVVVPVVPHMESGGVVRNIGFEDGWRAVAGRVWRNNFHPIVYAWSAGKLHLPFTPFLGCEYTKEFADAGGIAACERWGGIEL